MRGLVLLVLLLSACAPKAEPPPALPVLDCAKGFAALSAGIAASPALRPAPKEPGEPYRFYLANAGGTAFVVTEPGAPGHPAVLQQITAAGQMKTTGCPYGDLAGYQQVLAYLEGLSAGRR